MLAKYNAAFSQTDRGSIHDFVGSALLENAILVDTRLMRERVRTDDRFVGLHEHARPRTDKAAGLMDLSSINAGPNCVRILAGSQRHHHFLKRGVTGAFADTVNRAFDLACPVV